MIAKAVCEVGDVRFGFRVLLTAGLLAERARKQTIEAEEIASAIEEENRVRKLARADFVNYVILLIYY